MDSHISPSAYPDHSRPSSGNGQISALGFLGIFLLLLIPGVNLLLLLLWACGGCRKRAKRSLARGLLLFLLITVSLLTLLATLFWSSARHVIQEKGISIDAFTRTAAVLARHSHELPRSLQAGDPQVLEEVWAELDTRTRTDLLDTVSRSDMLSQAVSTAELPVPQDGENLQATLSCGSDFEFRGYIQLARLRGFAYEDFDRSGLTEEEAIAAGLWTGSMENTCIRARYADGAVIAEYMTRDTLAQLP